MWKQIVALFGPLEIVALALFICTVLIWAGAIAAIH